MTLFACCLLGPISAFCQYQHGTVVAFATTPDKMVMAADSHQNPTNNKAGGNNQACKIIQLTDHAIFSVSGVTSKYNSKASNAWNTYDEARSLAARHQLSNPDELERAAQEWGDFMSEKLNKALEGPALPIAEQSSFAATGVIGVYIPDRGIYFAMIEVGRGKGGRISAKPTVRVADEGFGTAGVGADVYRELERQATPRAKKAKHLHYALNNGRPHELENTTLDFARLAEQWLPHKTGGPIDEASVDKNGVHWILRKPACRNE